MSVTRRSSPPRCRDAEKIGLSRISPRLRVSAVKNRMASRFVIGIDLGTTDTALAYVDTGASADAVAPSSVAAAGRPRSRRIGSAPRCPRSCTSPPTRAARAGGAGTCRGTPERDFAVGEFARTQGARVPARLVVVGEVVALPRRRRPHGADPARGRAPLRRRSACRRSTRRRATWRTSRGAGTHAHRTRRSREQDVVLTVPASFDAVARELTVEPRARGRPRARHAARGAAGRVLRLARRARRCLAQAARRRRRRARVRCRRRHHRLLADRGHATRAATSRSSGSRSATTSCSAATTWTSRSRAGRARAR